MATVAQSSMSTTSFRGLQGPQATSCNSSSRMTSDHLRGPSVDRQSFTPLQNSVLQPNYSSAAAAVRPHSVESHQPDPSSCRRQNQLPSISSSSLVQALNQTANAVATGTSLSYAGYSYPNLGRLMQLPYTQPNTGNMFQAGSETTTSLMPLFGSSFRHTAVTTATAADSAVFPTRAPSASSALVNSSSAAFSSSSLLRRLSDTTNASDHPRTRSALSPYDLAGVGQSQKDSASKQDATTAITAALTGDGGRGSQFVCGVCGREFGMRCRLVAHARRHTGERPFACADCGRAFSDQGNLQRHRYTHSTEPRFHCTVCGKYFRQASCLSNHRRFHCAGASGRPCLFCKRTFRSSSSLQMHLRWKHRTDAAAMVAAAVTAMTGSEWEDEEEAEAEEVACGPTGRKKSLPGLPNNHTFSSSTSLDTKNPLDMQTVKRTQSDCAAAIVRPSDSIRRKWRRKPKPKQATSGLLSAKEVNSGETTATCSFPDAAAADNIASNLRAMATAAMAVSGDLCFDRKGRPCNFVCSACPRRFAFQCRLAAHMRSHANIRPFICPDCGRAFTQKGYLVRHGAVHKLDRPFVCTICERAYKHYGSLVNHRRTHSKQGDGEGEACADDEDDGGGAGSVGTATAAAAALLGSRVAGNRGASSRRSSGARNRKAVRTSSMHLALSGAVGPAAVNHLHAKGDDDFAGLSHAHEASTFGITAASTSYTQSRGLSLWPQNAFVPSLRHQSNSLFTSSTQPPATASGTICPVGKVPHAAAYSQVPPSSSAAATSSAFAGAHQFDGYLKETSTQSMLQFIQPHQGGIFLRPYYFPPPPQAPHR